MAIEAEVLAVDRPGESIILTVVFRANGVETKESLAFSGFEITADMIRERIKEVGRRRRTSDSLEVLAKTLLGEKILVEEIPKTPVAEGDPIEEVPDGVVN